MKPSIKKMLVLALVLAAGTTFMFTFARSTLVAANPDEVDSGLAPGFSATAARIGTAAASSSEAGTPVRVRVPKINIDAAVTAVGVGKSGNMAVPLTYVDAGWYRYGTLPGEVGSAVLDGHVDNGLGVPAVFARLGELTPGDDIYIDTATGKTLHFKVDDAATYAVADVPLERLFNRSDASRLNLITCEGTWLPEQKMYDERHVVYAVLQSS